MKQYDTIQLREVLNYDTHEENHFDFVERNQIHRAISRKMDGHDHHFPEKLQAKITEVHLKINATGYQAKEVVHYMEDETMLIKSFIKK